MNRSNQITGANLAIVITNDPGSAPVKLIKMVNNQTQQIKRSHSEGNSRMMLNKFIPIYNMYVGDYLTGLPYDLGI